MAAAARDLAADPAVADSGAHLEDKRYAVAVHTRRVADPDRWAGPVGQAAARVAAGHGLEVVPGRMVWELRPQVHSDKGDAVRRVAAESGAGALVVAGDDLGDLPGSRPRPSSAAACGSRSARPRPWPSCCSTPPTWSLTGPKGREPEHLLR